MPEQPDPDPLGAFLQISRVPLSFIAIARRSIICGYVEPRWRIIWTHAEVRRFMTRKRGNPNWGSGAISPLPSLPTEFEMQARRLHLRPEDYVGSGALHAWCERNRNRCYIPEWLLDDWGIAVDAGFSGYA